MISKVDRRTWVVFITIILVLSGTVIAGRGQEDVEVQRDIDSYPFEDEFPSVEELHAWYDELVEENPDITRKIHLGESWEGRDIWAVKVSDDVEEKQDQPSIFIHGNIHAREWSSNQVSSYYLWRIVNDYGRNETITWLVNNRQIYVAPMVNPDGYVYDGNGEYDEDGEGRWWRKNRNDSTLSDSVGVDLNRNWDINWEEGDYDPSSDLYRGEDPFSEYETQHLRDFILEKEIDSYQDIHSFWGTLLLPGSNDYPTSHQGWYEDMAGDMTSLTSKLGDEEKSYSYGTPDEELPGYDEKPHGTTVNWVYDETGAISLCYEIYTGDPYEGPYFYPPEDDIMDINLDLYDSLVYQARIADMDLGDGSDHRYPPSPYIVYGDINDVDANQANDSEVKIENLDTGETLETDIDSRGYYELNLGNLVEEGYEDDDTFSLHTAGDSFNFTVDESWGRRLDIEGEGYHHLSVDVEGDGTVEVDGLEVEDGWTQTYDEETDVELEAIPGEGWIFQEWTGDYEGNDEERSTINLTVDEDRDITAHFKEDEDEIPGFTSLALVLGLTITVAIYWKKV